MATHTNNYSVGMARFYFAETSLATRCNTLASHIKHDTANCASWDLGNVVTSEITPDITYLDHYISYAGDRRKDKTVAVTKSLNIPITLDEFSATNLEYFFGARASGKSTRKRVFSMDTLPVEGAGVLVFWTDIGKDFMYVIPKCALRTEGAALSFNAEDWSNLPMQIEVLHSSTYYPLSGTAASLAPYGYLDFTATTNAAPGV